VLLWISIRNVRISAGFQIILLFFFFVPLSLSKQMSLRQPPSKSLSAHHSLSSSHLSLSYIISADERVLLNIWSAAFAATKFDEVFSGYQRRELSVWNRRFEGHLGPHHEGSDTYPSTHWIGGCGGGLPQPPIQHWGVFNWLIKHAARLIIHDAQPYLEREREREIYSPPPRYVEFLSPRHGASSG